MVDISKALTSASHVSKFAPDARLPYMVEVNITAAQMIAAKGSALAAADVFDLIRVPAGTVVRGVWAKKTAAFTGTSTDLTVNIGYTGGDVDMWVAGWTFDDVAVGTFGIKGVGNALGTLGTIDTSIDGAASKISLVIATQTGTWTGGAFTLYVECIDLSDSLVAGTVTLGS